MRPKNVSVSGLSKRFYMPVNFLGMTGYTGIDDATMTTRPQDGTEAGFEKACTEFVSSLSNLPEGEFFFVDLWRKGRLVFFLVPFKNLYTSLWEMEQSMIMWVKIILL